MNTYEVKKINWENIKTHEEHEEENKKAEIIYIKGIEAVKNYVGANLKRQRAGYTAWNGNVEYIIIRVK